MQYKSALNQVLAKRGEFRTVRIQDREREVLCCFFKSGRPGEPRGFLGDGAESVGVDLRE